MKVYVCEYDTGWKVNKCETEKMRVLPNHMAQKTDFIYNGCFGHINEMFLTEQDAWESIKEKRMDKRYYLDYDGKVKPYI